MSASFAVTELPALRTAKFSARVLFSSMNRPIHVTAGRLLAGRSVVCLPAVRRWRGSWWGELLAVFTTEFLGGRRAVCWSLNVVADVS